MKPACIYHWLEHFIAIQLHGQLPELVRLRWVTKTKILRSVLNSRILVLKGLSTQLGCACHSIESRTIPRSSPHNFHLNFPCFNLQKRAFKLNDLSNWINTFSNYRVKCYLKFDAKLDQSSRKSLQRTTTNTSLDDALLAVLLSQYACTYSEVIWSIPFGIFYLWKFLLITEAPPGNAITSADREVSVENIHGRSASPFRWFSRSILWNAKKTNPDSHLAYQIQI